MKVHYTHLEEWKRNNPGKDWQKALLKLHYLELPSGMRRLWKEGDWNCHRSDFQLAELDRYNQRDYYSTAERKNHIVELIDKLAVPPRDKILSDRGRILDNMYTEPRNFEKFKGRKRKVDNGHTNKMDGG